MRKICIILCVVLTVLASVAVCYADRRGHGGEWHEHGGFDIFIGPAPFFQPYPAYPYCERVCRDRVVPVCSYDNWGDRWCHDEVVRDCRRVCY